jgi:D-alanyl-lipoteichoic acid acyltransferase DltB (MBOAT superfamily)
MFETLFFWVLLVITAASFQIIPANQVRARAAALTVTSILAVAFVVKLNPLWIFFLVASSVWVLVGLKLTRVLARNRPFLASWLVFLPVLIPWVVGKQAVALAWTPLTILYFVGFSFYLIKAWTLIKDYHDGRIAELDPFVVLAYFLFFPAYIAGPMHYFGEFDRTIRNLSGLNGEVLVDIVFRILLGFAKIKLVAALLIPVSLEAVKTSGRAGLRGLIFGSFAYSIVIWADFSGYSDLAIGTSRLVGIQTPENFNYPYAAANIREFWQRWHITFSRVLTAYIFIPVSRRLQKSFAQRRNLVLIVSYLVTFLFCGYWHGPTLNFLLWGLYHGAGLIVYDLYRQITTRRRLLSKGQPRSRFVAPLSHVASVALTFSFVSFGWIFFVLPTDMLLKRLSR